ncbi:MAG: glycosyltransferase family 4 protein [Candidatus Helarchaeota archaeon]
MKQKLRIAFIGTHGIPAKYGGSETAVEEMSLRLQKKGHSITVFGCSSSFRVEKKKYMGINIINLPQIPIKSLDYPVRGFLSTLIALFKSFDVYHFTGPDSGFYVLLTRILFFNKKTVVTLDGFPEDKESYSKITKFFLKFVFKLSIILPNIVIVDSKYIISRLKDKYNKEFHYLPYGGKFDSSNCDNNVLKKYNLTYKGYFLFVGRLVKEKGIHILIEGFKKAHSNKELVLVGEDVYGKNYEKKIKKQANDKIRFLGAIYGREYHEICKGAFAYITASNLEGSSPALIQAMAYGLPVIVSDIPQNVEVIGNAGIHFQKNNSDDLASKIELLENKNELVVELYNNSKKRIMEIYNWDKITADLEKLYLL